MKISSFGKSQQTEKQEGDIMDKYNELKGLSQDDLTRKLLDETARQKGEGTFDYQKLASTLESLKGYLPPENYEKMKSILESLK